jgi:prepilin-type processing-associated H-X9-DG protein
MTSRRHIRDVDVAVTLIATLLLLASGAAVGTAGRERAKRAVCLNNLKRLTQAWRQFANDYNGYLVNGAAGISRPREDPWVGQCWHAGYSAGMQLEEEIQREEIREGALWPYLQELKLYRCPSGYSGEMLNYMIVDSMNGLSRTGTVYGSQSARVGDTVLWVRTLSQIITPGPAERMVFIDTGWITPDSFATHYQQETWWDDPPVRHNDGMTASFADGHAEYWQWKGTDTIEYGRHNDRAHWSNNYPPQTPEGREDLHRFQRAVWGRLGYQPSEP